VIVKTRTDLLFILLGGDMHAAFETVVESPLATPTGKNLRLHHILGAFWESIQHQLAQRLHKHRHGISSYQKSWRHLHLPGSYPKPWIAGLPLRISGGGPCSETPGDSGGARVPMHRKINKAKTKVNSTYLLWRVGGTYSGKPYERCDGLWRLLSVETTYWLLFVGHWQFLANFYLLFL